MLLYLLKSSLCLSIILGIYRCFFEREKILHFNRYYLLIGLSVAHIIPLIENPFGMITTSSPVGSYNGVVASTASAIPMNNTASMQYNLTWEEMAYYGYILVASVLLIQLLMNIYKFRVKSLTYPAIRYKELTLVLTNLNETPHSFWRHIYTNRQDYEQGAVEEAVLLHEATHVRQLHSMDIILINVLQAIGWINPLYYLYRRSIQLNHEYLADYSVTQATHNVKEYQMLLLDHLEQINRNQLASNLNFLITKKRLQMMTKKTSKLKAMSLRFGGGLMLFGLIFLFGQAKAMDHTEVDKPMVLAVIEHYESKDDMAEKADRSVKSEPNEALIQLTESSSNTQLVEQNAEELREIASASKEESKETPHINDAEAQGGPIDKDVYYKNATIVFIDANGRQTQKRYSQLSEEEKSAIPPPPPPPPAPPGTPKDQIQEVMPLSPRTKVYFNHEGDIEFDGVILQKGSVRVVSKGKNPGVKVPQPPKAPPAPPAPPKAPAEEMVPPPPPPPPNPIEHFEELSKDGAVFYIDGEKATLEEAQDAVRNGVNMIDVSGFSKKKIVRSKI